MEPVARRGADGPVPSDREVDQGVFAAGSARTVVRPDGTVVRQRRGPSDLDADPCALEPGELAGVVDEHSVVHAYEVLPTHEALEVVRFEAHPCELATGGDAGLQRQQGVVPGEVHALIVGPRRAAPP